MKIPHWIRYGGVVFLRFWPLFAGEFFLIVASNVYAAYTGKQLSWHWFVWTTVACVIFSLFMQGLEEWKKGLPRLSIAQKVITERWPDPRGICTAFRFVVRNESTSQTIHRVMVSLTKVVPAPPGINWLPVPLHFMHDNVAPATDEWSINPGASRVVDMVSAPIAGAISIVHSVPGINSMIAPGGGDSFRRFRLHVLGTGEDVPPVEQEFDVWQDETGLLECETVTQP